MGEPAIVLAYDVGTTSTKTCLYEVSDRLTLIASSSHAYPLSVLSSGGVEQDPGDWWHALCITTHDVLHRSKVPSASIRALSFCSQMQGLVLVDVDGAPLRPAMSYMDQRAVSQWRQGMGSGVRVAGLNARRLLLSLLLTGGASASVKDPVWKYRWVRDNEPGLFESVHAWLDVKEYLVLRCTGRAVMTTDSANATFLYDSRPGRGRWSPLLLRSFGVEPGHLPPVVSCTATIGGLTAEAASDLGLLPGVSVIGGGGDVTMMALGSGCVSDGDTHVYVGTSGWVARMTPRRLVDVDHLIGPLPAARPGFYNYIGEQETSGKCLEWVRDHLALDEIGVYLGARGIHDGPESRYASLLDYLGEVVRETEPGSGGVVFTPWLHGNRSPFEDPFARGMFFNIGLATGKRKLIRAVVEGIAYHNRWLLECIEARCPTVRTLRFAGGGAVSDSTCQILADVTGKTVEAVANPGNAGAAGAALLCGVALGRVTDFEAAARLVELRGTFTPNTDNAPVYAKGFGVYKSLHRDNRKSFAALNSAPQTPDLRSGSVPAL